MLMGKITPIEGNVFSNGPLYLQMLYLFGTLVKNEILPTLLTFFMGLILILSIISFGKRFLFLNYSFIPSLSLASFPLTSFLMSTPIADLPLSLFLFLTFYSYLLYKFNAKSGWLFLTGFFAGFSMGIKYQGMCLFFLLPIFILILERNLEKSIKNILIVFLISIILVLPWFIKNIVYTGNPFYPMLFNYFGGKGWSEENNKRFLEDLHLKSPFKRLSLLYHVNFSSKVFGAGGIIGPLLLIFIPFSFFRRKDSVSNSLLMIALFSLFPFLTSGNLRYSYLSILLLSLFIPYGIEELKKFKGLKFIVFITFLIIIVSNSFTSFSHLNLVNPALNLVLGKEKKEDFLRNNLPFQKGIVFINKNLPSDSLILFLYEARTAYVRRKFISATPYDNNILKDILKRNIAPDKMLEELKNKGITHIFLNESEMNRIEGKFDYLGIRDPEIKKKFYSFLLRLSLIYSNQGIYIYSLF